MWELGTIGAVSAGAQCRQYGKWVEGGGDGLCAGVGCVLVSLCLGGPPAGYPKTYLGYGYRGEELVLRPCLGCFLPYKERTEVDKSLCLVKNNCCSCPI